MEKLDIAYCKQRGMKWSEKGTERVLSQPPLRNPAAVPDILPRFFNIR